MPCNMYKKMKLAMFAKRLISFCLLAASLNFSEAGQAENLLKLFKSKRSKNTFNLGPSTEASGVKQGCTPVYIGPQDGSQELDKITAFPGQPNGVNFNQYSGYVTVDPQAGRALFYYFVESPQNSSTNPLVLWLNGGLHRTRMFFRVNSGGKTLLQNTYAWNNVANVIFLESPAGVGFSYSNTTSDYRSVGDNTTAIDAYIFLVNWLERFPQYKARDFFITGESYAGHYVHQLANTILLNNKYNNQTIINLKGIAIGNGLLNSIDDLFEGRGNVDYQWSHALMSDETHKGILDYCFVNNTNLEKCYDFLDDALDEKGAIDDYNIYAPLCHNDPSNNHSKPSGSIANFDPCTDDYVYTYLNIPEVQTALHARNTTWQACSDLISWSDSAPTVIPLVKNIMTSGVKVWIYSGDIDSVVSVTYTRYLISSLNLPIKTAWYPWYSNDQVGGYVVAYEGLVFVTVRGAGHLVPSYQPERALTMISSFVNGVLPPSK